MKSYHQQKRLSTKEIEAVLIWHRAHVERPKTVESQIEGSSSKSSLDKSFGTLLQLSSLTVKSDIRASLNKSRIKNSKEVYIPKFYLLNVYVRKSWLLVWLSNFPCFGKQTYLSNLIVEFEARKNDNNLKCFGKAQIKPQGRVLILVISKHIGNYCFVCLFLVLVRLQAHECDLTSQRLTKAPFDFVCNSDTRSPPWAASTPVVGR